MGFVALGIAVGALGTMIGAGGGFILVPILLALFPEAPHSRIAAISMTAVALNATSGSIAYLWRKRVHLRAAFAFTVAGLPGAVLGVQFEKLVSRDTFELIFGACLIAYAATLLLKRIREPEPDTFHHKTKLSAKNYWVGFAISFFVGFLASFLGIGGGVIHVPLLAHLIGFPVHLAAGTSHFILAITAWVASAEHVHYSHIALSDPVVLELGLGVLVGAQIGAALSHYVSGKVILKLLGMALLTVGIRLVYNALSAL